MFDFVTAYNYVKSFIHLIKLDEKNRMVRLGFGKNDGNWFVRADLWWFGVRISKT